MKLVDSPAVVLKEKLKYDDLPEDPKMIRHERPTGEIHVKDIEPHTSTTQPEPDTKTGAADVRTREEIPEGGHHVSGSGAVAEPYKHDVIGLNKNLAKHVADETHVPAPTPEAKAREAFVKSRREAKDKTFESTSGRKPLKEMLSK